MIDFENFTLNDWTYDGVDLLIIIKEFNPDIPEDIEIEILEVWETKGTKYFELKKDSHPVYEDRIIAEKAIDYAYRARRENIEEQKCGS